MELPYVPPEIIKQFLMNMEYKDIIKSQHISKDYDKIIRNDKFWCELLKRDFKDVINNKFWFNFLIRDLNILYNNKLNNHELREIAFERTCKQNYEFYYNSMKFYSGIRTRPNHDYPIYYIKNETLRNNKDITRYIDYVESMRSHIQGSNELVTNEFVINKEKYINDNDQIMKIIDKIEQEAEFVDYEQYMYMGVISDSDDEYY